MATNYALNYTGKEIDELLAKVQNLPEDISTLKFETVSKLPVENINLSTIYLVKTDDNDYEEYIYINGAWEMLGTTKIDLTPYATKEYVNEHIETNLAGYATEIYVNNKVDAIEIPSITGLATEEYVNNAIDAIDFPETDLTGYATEEYVDTEIGKINIPSIEGLASETYVNNATQPKANKTYVDEELAKKANTSALVGLATENYVNIEVAKKVDAEYVNSATSPKADKTYVDNELAKKANTSALTGLASETYVDTKIANLIDSAPETLNTLGEIAAAVQENDNVIDTLNAAIGTKANKSEIPSLDGYATETYVSNSISTKTDKTYVDSELAKKADLLAIADMASKTYVNNAVSSKANTTDVNSALDLKADKTYVDTELSNKANTSALTGLATESYVNSKIVTTQYTTMPTITTANQNSVIQYVGATTAKYTKGAWYEVKYDPETIEFSSNSDLITISSNYDRDDFLTGMEDLFRWTPNTSKTITASYYKNFESDEPEFKYSNVYFTLEELGVDCELDVHSRAITCDFPASLGEELTSGLRAGTDDTEYEVLKTSKGYRLCYNWAHNKDSGNKYLAVRWVSPSGVPIKNLYYWHSVNGVTQNETSFEFPEEYGYISSRKTTSNATEIFNCLEFSTIKITIEITRSTTRNWYPTQNLATENFVEDLVESSAYRLPKATATTLGGIKVGENLSITSTGILSAIVPEVSNIPDIQMSTTDLTAGTSELANGSIYFVYE